MKKVPSASSTVSAIMWLAFTILLPDKLFSQRVETAKLDSFLKQLPQMADDTGKVKLLNNISYTYFTIDPQEGIRYGLQSESLALKLKWQKGLARAYNSIGANYWAKNDFLKSQEFYLKSLRINTETGDRLEMATNLHNIAGIYDATFNYPKALDYYERAIKIEEEIGNTEALLGFYANIAEAYEGQGYFSNALKYYDRSMKLAESSNNKRNIAFMSGKIGNVFSEQKNYAKALEYEKKSLQTFKDLDDKDDIAIELLDIGSIYLNQKDFSQAINYFSSALELFRSASGKRAVAELSRCYGSIGNTYFNKYKYAGNQKALLDSASFYLEKSIAISKSISDWEGLNEILQILSDVQTEQGNYAAALKTYKQYALFRDSISNSDKDKEIARKEFEFAYSLQKDSLNNLNNLQKAQLLSLQQKEKLDTLTFRQRWLYTIIALVFIAMTGIYFFSRNRILQLNLKNMAAADKAEKELKEAQYKRSLNEITFAALRSQMNPHFIFNALNTIQSYMYTNDKVNAISYLGKFSDLIRKILDSSNKEFNSLEEEIELLRLYIDIEKARFGENLQGVINVNPAILPESIFIPPMLIQPFVENAVKHGLLHRSGEKKLVLEFKESDDGKYIVVVIDDNGIGRMKSAEINQKRIRYNSFASNATEKRIALISQLHGEKAKMVIDDKVNADGTSSGTTVTLIIPVIRSEIEQIQH